MKLKDTGLSAEELKAIVIRIYETYSRFDFIAERPKACIFTMKKVWHIWIFTAVWQ